MLVIYMYIAPGQGQTTPWGQYFFINKYSVNLVISWKFFPSNDFLTVSPIQTHKRRKIGQGQQKVIIYTNFLGLESPMMHVKFQDQGKKITIYEHGGHLGPVTGTIYTALVPPSQGCYI